MVPWYPNRDFVWEAEHSRVLINHALIEEVHLVRLIEADYLKSLCPVHERLGDFLQLPRLGLEVLREFPVRLAAETGKTSDIAEHGAPVCH